VTHETKTDPPDRSVPDTSPSSLGCPTVVRLAGDGTELCMCDRTCEAQIRVAGMFLAEHPDLEISIHSARIQAAQYARERCIRLQHVTARAVRVAALRAGRAAPGGRYVKPKEEHEP
jgi:hypothetical protein